MPRGARLRLSTGAGFALPLTLGLTKVVRRPASPATPSLPARVSAATEWQDAARSVASEGALFGRGAAVQGGPHPQDLNERRRYVAVAAGLKEGRRETLLPRAPGAADAVHVRVDVRGQIIVDMTWVTCWTSSPRKATSVATRMGVSPFLNCTRACTQACPSHAGL